MLSMIVLRQFIYLLLKFQNKFIALKLYVTWKENKSKVSKIILQADKNYIFVGHLILLLKKNLNLKRSIINIFNEISTCKLHKKIQFKND